MKNVCTVLYLVFAGVYSTVIELNTNQEGHFLISLRVVGASGVPLIVPLIHPLGEGLGERRRYNGEYLNITTANTESLITQNLLSGIPARPEDFIPIGFRSVFATDFARTYMMIPMHRQLVINPENPRTFVYESMLALTRSASDEYPQVRVSVSILNTAQGDTFVPSASVDAAEIHEYLLATVDLGDFVPSSIIRALCDEIRRRQISYDPVYGFDGTIRGFDIIGDLSDEVIDTLPIVQYRIHTDSGNYVNIALDGRDYIGPLDGGIRELLLFSGDVYAFGLNTLSKVALYIDNSNKTIGFGEPL